MEGALRLGLARHCSAAWGVCDVALPFEKLAVLRCLRPDKLVPGIQVRVRLDWRDDLSGREEVRHPAVLRPAFLAAKLRGIWRGSTACDS